MRLDTGHYVWTSNLTRRSYITLDGKFLMVIPLIVIKPVAYARWLIEHHDFT